jgi:hypothetical protein
MAAFTTASAKTGISPSRPIGPSSTGSCARMDASAAGNSSPRLLDERVQSGHQDVLVATTARIGRTGASAAGVWSSTGKLSDSVAEFQNFETFRDRSRDAGLADARSESRRCHAGRRSRRACVVVAAPVTAHTARRGPECSARSVFSLVAELWSWKLGRRIPLVAGRPGYTLVPTPSGVERGPRAVTLAGSKRQRER